VILSLIQRHGNTILLLFAIALGIFVLSSPATLDSVTITGIYGLIALSVGLIYGQAGILSVAQGMFAAIGAYVTAVLSTRWGWSPYVSLFPSIAIPAALAYLISVVVIRLSPLAVALGTLAFARLVEIGIRGWDSVTGGYVGISGIPRLTGLTEPLAYASLAWVTLALAVFLYENLMRSMYGTAINTIRHDRARAIADGINVNAILGATFALSAAIAGTAGWLYAHYIGFIDPNSLDSHLSISAMLMAVVGGAATILGPIIGAVVLSALLQFLPAQEVQGLFFGGALILVLVVAQRGLLGTGLAKSIVRRLLRSLGVPRAAKAAPGEAPA
jgi:branched-chain amino acid transport system permease protein